MVAVSALVLLLGSAVLAQARTTNLVFVPPNRTFPDGVTGKVLRYQ